MLGITLLQRIVCTNVLCHITFQCIISHVANVLYRMLRINELYRILRIHASQYSCVHVCTSWENRGRGPNMYIYIIYIYIYLHTTYKYITSVPKSTSILYCRLPSSTMPLLAYWICVCGRVRACLCV